MSFANAIGLSIEAALALGDDRCAVAITTLHKALAKYDSIGALLASHACRYWVGTLLDNDAGTALREHAGAELAAKGAVDILASLRLFVPV
jgi:hypothetical protein